MLLLPAGDCQLFHQSGHRCLHYTTSAHTLMDSIDFGIPPLLNRRRAQLWLLFRCHPALAYTYTFSEWRGWRTISDRRVTYLCLSCVVYFIAQLRTRAKCVVVVGRVDGGGGGAPSVDEINSHLRRMYDFRYCVDTSMLWHKTCIVDLTVFVV